jgi:hypothetical protein
MKTSTSFVIDVCTSLGVFGARTFWQGLVRLGEADLVSRRISEISAEEYEALRQGLRQGEERGYGSPVKAWFDGRDSALELARMRFARGEIGPEEFERIRKGLTG